MVRIVLIVTVFLLAGKAIAQQPWATIHLNRSQVYANQPIKATINVYTPTWFTEPLQFENLVVPDAFVLPFKRTQSGMYTISGKKYAGLQFYFLIYPYEVGQYSIPPFNITAYTPPAGDYKGVPVVVSTNESSFQVLPIPPEFEGVQWLVANSLRISDQWDKPLESIRVGDVVTRSVRIEAYGTLPSLIPELPFEPLDFARIYPKRPQTEDTRTTRQANGIRTERRTYLFEKEGTFDLPEEILYYWNPIRNRQQEVRLAGRSVTVMPNEDLGMLASVRDSLDAAMAETNTAAMEDTPFPWRLWLMRLVWLGVALLNVYLMFSIFRLLRLRWYAYKQSAAYLKRTARRAATKNSSEFLQDFYRWWDSVYPQPSVRETAESQYLGKVESHYLTNEPAGDDGKKLIEETATFTTPEKNADVPLHQRPIGNNR